MTLFSTWRLICPVTKSLIALWTKVNVCTPSAALGTGWGRGAWCGRWSRERQKMIFRFEREGGACGHTGLTFELYSLRGDDPSQIVMKCKTCKRDLLFARV